MLTPGEKIAALERDVKNNSDDIREIRAAMDKLASKDALRHVRDDMKAISGKVEAHGALMRWVMMVSAVAGALAAMFIKRAGEAMGL